MLHSTFCLIPIVILLSAWATVARAITPPKGLPVFIPPPGWLESAEIIGYIAQNFVKWYRRRSPFYEWLLPPQLDSIELKSGYLQESGSMLDALKRRQDEIATTPEPLELGARLRLEHELDTYLRTCIFTVVARYYDENPPVSTFSLGSEQVVKGAFNDDDFKALKVVLNMNYKRCRSKGQTEEHCRRQTEVTVGGKTIKADGELQSQMLSHSELLQTTRRIVERYFPSPVQMGEKKNPAAVLRGGAQPLVPRFRPY